MIRALLDANTLVSGAIASRGAVAELIDRWLVERLFLVVLSDEILDEVDRALRNRYFAARLDAANRAAYLDLLRQAAVVVSVQSRLTGVAPDPNDDHVLAAAIDGAAEYLVTGDRGLLGLGSYRGVRIVNARELLDVMRS